jgi:hypothetical protein
MPMLGDLLAAARDSAGAFQVWLARSDPVLAARVTQAAGHAGDSPAAFVRAAISDFARFASEDDWAMLMSRLRGGSNDPGTICLVAMIEWRLHALDAHARHHSQLDEGMRS